MALALVILFGNGSGRVSLCLPRSSACAVSVAEAKSIQAFPTGQLNKEQSDPPYLFAHTQVLFSLQIPFLLQLFGHAPRAP